MEFKLLDALDRKAGLKQTPMSMIMGPSQAAFTEENYEKIAREGYKRNPFVYSALDFSGDVFSDVELTLKRRNGSETEEISDHPLIDLLNKPNDDQGGASYKKELFIFLKLAGKSYTHLLFPDTGQNSGIPQQMVNWVPSKVEVRKNEDRLIADFRRTDTQKIYPKEEIVYIKEFHPTETANGHPAAMSASRVVDVSNAQLEWNYSVLKNRGIPAHVFRGQWSPEQARKWQRRNERETGGEYRAGKDLYLPDSVEVERLGFNTQELDWLEGMKEMKRIIYSVYKTPSVLMNDGENATYSNYEQAVKSMIYHNTLPAWRLVLDAWNHQLVPKFGEDLFLEVDMDSIASLQESMMEKLEKGIKAYESNLANKGESREMAGMDSDVPDADRSVLKSSFIPDDSDVGDEDVDTDEFADE